MLKRFTLLSLGYFVLLFIIYIISTWDERRPSNFLKLGALLTPLYLIAFFSFDYFIKKNRNVKK